jgi:hypothetical protein
MKKLEYYGQETYSKCGHKELCALQNQQKMIQNLGSQRVMSE